MAGVISHSRTIHEYLNAVMNYSEGTIHIKPDSDNTSVKRPHLS